MTIERANASNVRNSLPGFLNVERIPNPIPGGSRLVNDMSQLLGVLDDDWPSTSIG